MMHFLSARLGDLGKGIQDTHQDLSLSCCPFFLSLSSLAPSISPYFLLPLQLMLILGKSSLSLPSSSIYNPTSHRLFLNPFSYVFIAAPSHTATDGGDEGFGFDGAGGLHHSML